MRARFNQSFKRQAVEKALGRSGDTSLDDVAAGLGVGNSTLRKWLKQSRAGELDGAGSIPSRSKERRPQDWSVDEKLDMVIACGSLDEAGIGAHCRREGIYPHHVTQWKAAFMQGKTAADKARQQTEVRQLKSENKALRVELRRKEKALAEAAALLILQKKVTSLWGDDEDGSP